MFGAALRAWPRYRDAPAAKHYHQAYRHGLLEHCLSVAQGVSAVAAAFAGIDRDLAVTGALLHDIGKLEAYTADAPAIDLTDAAACRARSRSATTAIRRAIEELDGFPRDWRGGGAHHPLPPRLARARLAGGAVHARGDARAHDRQPRRAAGLLRPAGEGAAGGQAWSAFDRALGAGAFFGFAAAAEQQEVDAAPRASGLHGAAGRASVRGLRA